jgi:ABC-type multidrug transport system permease subunit
LTYLFGGLIIAVNANQHVICDSEDLLKFPPPSGQTCGDYAGEWARDTQANLTNPGATDECRVCQYMNGSQYLEGFNLNSGMLANNIWAYWAVFMIFTVANVGFFYFFTWARSVKKWKLFYFF